MTQTQEFIIKGMDCANCARTVEKGVGQLDGIQTYELSFTTERLRVQGDVARETVIQRVRDLGYDVVEDEVAQTAAEPPARNFWHFMWQRPETRSALIGALLILPGLILTEIAQIEHPAIAIFSLLALVIAGWPVAQSAWRALRINREININVLMTVAAVGAVIIGAYTEAGMVMVLFAIGEGLEGYTADKARQSIRSLMDVMPQQAVRLDKDECCGSVSETVVPIAELKVGDVIVVKPGERIPMDGRVQAGQSAVNQAPITGESQLIAKTRGEEVFASSINGEGALEIEVTHLAADNTIARLIKLVEEAQENRAPAQRFVDRFAHYYTPAVMIIAILVALIPPLFFNQPFWNPNPETFGWLYRGLALLVVACPCALVISTPVSLISAISNGARHGVLFKGGAYVEALSRVKAIAFDKTGTLTAGQPAVVEIRAVACTGDAHCAYCDEVLALAHAVEQRSEHPVAQAITQAAAVRGVNQRYPAAESVTALTGRGVTGQVNGRTVTIGSHAYFDDQIPHPATYCEAAHTAASQGYTPLMVSTDGTFTGTISVADTVRPSSQEAVAKLKQQGLGHIIMLTGDNAATAAQIAAEVGVTEVKAELLPEHKVTAVQELQQQFGAVAMVGDGINDAPALATAEVGIAIGGATGTAQAMETADVTLMSDDLRQLPFAMRLSQAAMRTIYVNVILAIGIKLAFMGLVLLGLGTMWMAVAADVGTSVLVTLYGMRLLNYR
ncbi:MAG: heavy metal translocating P-type ATPase [Anaerolineales bacterium]|nr:heavy metal translocating P-type ATPase [Anaerolineales bacterium]